MKLKPCPFCGKHVNFEKIGVKLYQFKCQGCKFKFRYNGQMKKAEEAWNTRIDGPPDVRE